MAVITAAVSLFGFSAAQKQKADPVTHTSAIKNSNQAYDAQIVNQKNSSNPIYRTLPTNPKSLPKISATAGTYNGKFVRVLKIRVTRAGAYAYIRYFDKTLGWISLNALQKTTLSQIAAATMKQYNAIGCALLISAGIKNTAMAANGYADQKAGILNETSGKVLYPLASLQKSMTGAIIQQLISSGKISINDKLSQWYPQVKHADQITIKQMLTMTSGLNNNDYTPKANMTENQAITSMLTRLSSDGKSTYQYSDANFVLLAGIIAKVTGSSYENNLKTRIFEQVNMNNTLFAGEPVGNKMLEQSYLAKNDQNYATAAPLPVSLQTTIPGAGNLYTTLSDYFAFQSGLGNGQILTSSQFKQLLSYGKPYSGGFYVNNPGIKQAHGGFNGTGIKTDLYANINNYHGALVFLNQMPLNNQTSSQDFAKIMYQISRYY